MYVRIMYNDVIYVELSLVGKCNVKELNIKYYL